MKIPKRCPKCGFDNPTPITNTEKHFYCPKCNHAWENGKEKQSLDQKGDLNFSGVEQAKQIIDSFLKTVDMGAELKTAFAVHLTNVFYEQWFEGFKTGTLADIINKKEFSNDNDKIGTKPGATNREHRNGDRSSLGQDDKDSIGQLEAGRPRKSFDRVKERISGVEFIRPRNLTPTELQYQGIAELIVRTSKDSISEIEFTGTHYVFKFKA